MIFMFLGLCCSIPNENQKHKDLPRDESMLSRAARVFKMAWWYVANTVGHETLEAKLSWKPKWLHIQIRFVSNFTAHQSNPVRPAFWRSLCFWLLVGHHPAALAPSRLRWVGQHWRRQSITQDFWDAPWEYCPSLAMSLGFIYFSKTSFWEVPAYKPTIERQWFYHCIICLESSEKQLMGIW